ncbi:hypothetical protein E7T06_08695 [Deinococcus sp. Arct2-2]|uniref:hypothetical protein n=1 Tax=Deinococcus sp. Arct2-2 TaxID=2568653 RepID=UPI0010A39DE6|nr:hypothetical protein [Deinococcus sp. Arct2-2]THF70121.1 hypothetical protein E7T06_08695 [Deinococcus sp. Arct2-2]
MQTVSEQQATPDLRDALPTAAPAPSDLALHGAPVLLLSASVGNRASLERMLEGLGLSVRVTATLRAARTALHATPHAAALVNFPISGLQTAEDLLGGLPAGHAPPLLTLGAVAGSTVLGDTVLSDAVSAASSPAFGGSLALIAPVSSEALREALAPLLPNHPLAALPRYAEPGQEQRLLLTDLMAKPGVLGVTLLDASGQSVAQQGETLPPQLGLPLIAALEATQSFGDVLHGGPLHTAQLEYQHRTLLLARHGPHVIACLLRDPSTSSLIRYLLRTRLAA